jgi:hypothetical protein
MNVSMSVKLGLGKLQFPGQFLIFDSLTKNSCRMKIIKIILLTLLAIAVLLAIVAAVFKKSYSAQAEVVIDRPYSEVYGYVKLLKNQDEFSVWAKMDPEMEKTYRGTDGEVGFVSAWKSENPDVGRGEQEIKAISANRIDYELRFLAPWESTSPGYITFDDMDGKTKVVWVFEGNMPYPMNLMMLMYNIEEMIRTDLQTGLDNLKALLESMPEPEAEEIEEMVEE